MIKLTINQAIFIYTLSSVVVTLIIWIISNYRVKKEPPDQGVHNIWKCSVCFNTYIDSKHEEISNCPQCGSYNKRESEKGGRL